MTASATPENYTTLTDVTHSPKLRLVVMMTLARSQSLLSRWKSNAPPEALNGR